MNIFIGFENIASIIGELKFNFEKQGHNCFTALSAKRSSIVVNEADFILDEKAAIVPLFRPRRISAPLRSSVRKYYSRRLFERAMKENDVFIFLWSSFNHDFSDLEILKKAGKKVIFIFVGDDARWHFAANQEFGKYQLPLVEYGEAVRYTEDYLKYNLLRIRSAEKHCDFIFSRLDQAQLQLRPYFRWNMMVSADGYGHFPGQRQKPKIVHAPSSFVVKGSRHIIEVMNRLEKDGLDFEFELIQNMDHSMMKKKIGEADMLIDQLLIPGSGKISTEALASGKVVLSHMAYGKYPQDNPPGCPIVDVDPLSLYTVLKELIPDHARRSALASQGRTFAEAYLDVSIFTRKVERLLNGGQVPFDYVPVFYRNDFIPENERYARIYRESDKMVSDCDWYRNAIHQKQKPG